jgi:hypothetical protein
LPCLLGVYNLSSNLFFSFSPEGGAAKVLSAPSHSLCRPRGKEKLENTEGLLTRTLKDRRISTGVKKEKKTKRES